MTDTTDITPAAEPTPTVTPSPSGQGKVGKNVAVTVITQLASWALAFLVTLYLPPYAGPVGLGRMFVAGSLAAIITLAMPLGTSTVLIKGVARDRSRTGRLLGTVLALRVPGIVLSPVLVLGASYVLGYDSRVRGLLLAYIVGTGLALVNEALAATLQGLERLPRQNAAALAEKFLGSILAVALIFLRAPLWMIVLSASIAVMPSLLMNGFALRAELSEALRRVPSLTEIRGVAREGLPYMGSGVFRGFYEHAIPIALGLVGGMAAAGWYSAASRLVGTAIFLPYALTTALLPTLSRLWTEDRARFGPLAQRMFALTMWMAVPVALVLLCLPDQVIAVLRYDSFAESIPVLRVGGITTLLFFASFALGTTIIAADRQAEMFRAAVVALFAGVPWCTLVMWIAHRLVGNAALGGMAGVAGVEALLIALYFRALPVRLIDRAVISLLLRYMLASAPAGLLLWWCAVRGVGLWAVLPCAAIYVGATLALRAVDPGAVAALRRVLAATAAILRRGFAAASGGLAPAGRTR